MQISEHQIDESSLAAFGAEAVRLLCSGDIDGLADRFGYALAHGREPVLAIRSDLASCLTELSASALVLPLQQDPATVKYFGGNAPALFALVECHAPTNHGSAVLVELVVSCGESSKYITLEQISAVA